MEMADVSTTEEKAAAITSASRVIDQLKERIDHARLEVELGKLDARDEVVEKLDVAQNACLAADAKLREAVHDLAVTAEAVRDGVHQLVRDVKKTIDAVEAAISRG
jgi:hypothetical protein